MASSASLNPFNFSSHYQIGGGSYVFSRDHAVVPHIQRIAVQHRADDTAPVAAGATVSITLDTYEPTLSTLPSSFFNNANDTVFLPHAGHWEIRIECDGSTANTTGSCLTFGIRIGSTGTILPIAAPITVPTSAITAPRLIVTGDVQIPAGKNWQIVVTNAAGANTYTIDYLVAGVYFTAVFTYRGE